MRGKAERGWCRERNNPLLGGVPAGRGGYGARDQAGRSDNTASRACHFEVSTEQPAKDGLFLAKFHNPLTFIYLIPFSGNQ